MFTILPILFPPLYPISSYRTRKPFDARCRLDTQYKLGCELALDVLIVDNSAATRKILQRVLRQAEVPIGQVFEASDGVEALETLKQQKVDLILTDINLPNMDGLQFLGKVRANAEWDSVPVVIITTEGGQGRVMEAVQLGAAAYVRKPFTAEQIKEKIGGIQSSLVRGQAATKLL
jgi:two-component system, chemotaxis family, chemotaxis protein CheY